jgi:hypothetical protein
MLHLVTPQPDMGIEESLLIWRNLPTSGYTQKPSRQQRYTNGRPAPLLYWAQVVKTPTQLCLHIGYALMMSPFISISSSPSQDA